MYSYASSDLRQCPYDYQLTNKAYLSTVRNIYESFTHRMAAKTSWRRYGTKLRHCHLCIRLCLISEQNFRMHLANSVILKPRHSLRNASENSKTTNSFILINEFYKIMQRNKHVNSVISAVDILNLIQTASRSMQPF